jgi:hypothetical protein
LERPVPFDCETFNEEDLLKVQQIDKRIEWKIKGLAAKFSFRLFCKHGSVSSRAQNEVATDFTTAFKFNFMNNLMPMLLDSHLTLVFKRKSHFVGSRALIYSLRFLTKAVTVPLAMNIMQPYLENLLFETTVPIILVTTHDLYLFREDPIEFLRK